MWNRRAHEEYTVKAFERVGARVVVAENGYIGRDEEGGKLYALALTHHNGCGEWPVGSGRWPSFGIECAPWRRDGDFILVLPQRSIGCPGVAMPVGWLDDIVPRLKALTKRPIRVRPHPGISKEDPYEALRGAWAAVTWGSGAGIKSIVGGVPVFHDLPDWIGGPAARPVGHEIEDPYLGDREPMLERLAWSQWRKSEIASGEALKWLLG